MLESGLESDRLRMVNMGAADARPFAEIMKDMAETIRKLGQTKVKKMAY
jgi:coenzyme F420-reducing hydrogenase delta subunit